ncbi:unnamed protein product [Camellia sinensis]
MEKFGLPDILKSKHEENEAYISELELSWVFNNNELSGKIPSTKRTTADFGDIVEALGEIVEQLGKKGWNFNLKHYDKNLNWQTPIVDSCLMYDCTVNCTCLSDDECHISAIGCSQD